MATNENVNKVIYGNQTVMDITDTTAEESDVASGEVFYKANGERSVGTLNADSAVWGSITGTLSDQTDLQIELNRAYTKTASETSSIDDLDVIPVQKISASSDGRRNVKFRNLKSILKGFFDDIYQAILTFDNTPTVNSDNPVKSSGIYNALMPKVSESLLKSTVGWTGKNLLPNNATSQTINGVTFTVNDDGSVKANGTAAGASNFILAEYVLPEGDYIASKGYSSSPSTHCGLIVEGYNGSTWVKVLASSYSTDEQSFSVDYVGYDRIRVTLKIDQNDVVSNLMTYPMIRKADIIDSTFEPYHESVEEEIEQIYADNGVLGAKNLGDLKLGYALAGTEQIGYMVNQSAAGSITLIAKIDKGQSYRITKNGSKGNRFRIIAFNNYPIGGYDTTAMPIVGDSSLSSYEYTNSSFNYLAFTCNYDDTSVTPSDVQGMIRLASDPDDTYVPYAMTNRELTEAIETIPTVNNGQLTIQQNGTNKATFTANQSGNATANIVTDEWVATGTVSSGSVSFSGIDDSGNYGYKPFAEVTASSTNKNPSAQISTLSGTGTSSMSVTYTTDADNGTTVKLRRIK